MAEEPGDGDADFRGARFEGADFTGATFRDCDLRGVRIADAMIADGAIAIGIDVDARPSFDEVMEEECEHDRTPRGTSRSWNGEAADSGRARWLRRG